jgi:hypothetical protein
MGHGSIGLLVGGGAPTSRIPGDRHLQEGYIRP